MLIADRTNDSCFVLAAQHQRGIDFVIREAAARKRMPDRAHVPGRGDRLVVWSRPLRPGWMPEAVYERMPETIQVHKVHEDQRCIVTSLPDPHHVPAAEVARRYRQRWTIELDFRSITCAMQMHVLNCRAPDMVRKEVAAHLLAFNLIRVLAGQAAAPAGLQIRQLSFAAATYQGKFRGDTTARNRAASRFMLLQQIA